MEKTIYRQLQEKRDEAERRRQDDLKLRAEIAEKVIAERQAQEARESLKQNERHELA